ncbi:extracellular solute-binding protein [Paenibacillus sp. IB182496]|uniref:Extracellular solute-binding protein n=1 Tax=Paenibacillus sabuli TaxID=2772509 RepID=A0A927GQC8_9BACL|nr:extracellular solute-binding protein [Paenibacillus sabuli]MBD2844141.1 extracellular solute-binding protein [Paenibacillus sabuli]
MEIEIMTDLTQENPDLSNEYWAAFQSLTNTRLNILWVPGNEYSTKLDLVLASGDIPEVVFGREHNKPTLINAIRQGAFWDLTPFLGDFSRYPNLRDNMTPGAWSYVRVDDKIMGIPRSRSLIDSGLKIRKDWLERLELPVPTTMDEYKETLIAIANGDPDGNGMDDTIGLAIGPEPDPSLQAAFGVYNPTYDEAGGLMYNYLTPQFTQLVGWLRELYAAGALPDEFAALNGTQLSDMIESGRAASFNYAIYRDYSWTNEIRKVQPEGQLITLPPMRGPNGDYAASLDIGTRGAHHISKKVSREKVEAILQYFERTASAELTDFAYYGKEGVHYNVSDNGEKVLTELGREQMNVNTLSPITPSYTRWGKVIAPEAPQAWNEEKKLEAAPYEELGVIDPFRYLISDTWIEAWPKYSAELESMWVKAISGKISMQEYEECVEKIKRDPQIQKAFQEFAADLSNRNPANDDADSESMRPG